MSETGQDDERARRQVSKWQFSLWDLLVLTLAVSAVLAAGRTFHGGLNPLELAVILLAGLSVLLVGIPSRAHWPWYLGLGLCLIAVWFLPLRPLNFKATVGAVVSGVYILAGLMAILPIGRSGRKLPWMLGAFGCFVLPAAITSADFESMLLVAGPLCLCYVVVAIAGRKRRRVLWVVGPAFVVAGLAIAIGGGCLVAEVWAQGALRIGVAVAILGALSTIMGWSGEVKPTTEPSGG